jgi:hypothetical protein
MTSGERRADAGNSRSPISARAVSLWLKADRRDLHANGLRILSVNSPLSRPFGLAASLAVK